MKSPLRSRLWCAVLVWTMVIGSVHAQTESTELRIMTFNIWLGGELVDFGKVIEAIEAANADIVGLQEANGNTRRLAAALGWPYVSERLQIISRYPLIDPPGGGGSYVWAQLSPGRMIALANLHLPSDPYGPYLIRDGATLEQVLENERATRMPMLEAQLAKLTRVTDSEIPLFITGDFNSPSHHDWTAEAMRVRETIKYPVRWPVTAAVERAGFRDTYRAVHPDPVADPGMTWTYGYPYPRLRPGEIIDRIDLVFATPNVKVLKSEIVGPRGSLDADIGITPFPSDHRGVVSTVQVTPTTPLLFVAAEARRIERGDAVVVRYHAPAGEAEDRIVIVQSRGDPADAIMALPPYEADFFGSVTFGSATLEPGLYDTVLVGKGNKELSRNSFWVVEQGAVSSLETDKATYQVGEVVTTTWDNAPANRWDWLGVYAVADPDLYNYLGFVYTDARVSGKVTLDKTALGETMLPPGEYEVRLMLDDSYEVLASKRFRVVP